MSQRFDAVLLDAYGVLILPDPRAIRERLLPFGAQPTDNECERVYRESVRRLDQVADPDWALVNRTAAIGLGVANPSGAAVTAVGEIYTGTECVPVAGAKKAIARLLDASVPVVVVSNSQHGRVRDVLHYLGLIPESSLGSEPIPVVDSAVVGMKKPSRTVFEYALGLIGAEAGRTVHVGDSLRDDIDGGAAAGLATVHIDPQQVCKRDHHHSPSIEAWTRQMLP